MNRTFYLHTYGCQMNERDSEMVAACLEQQGFRQVDEESEAEVIIVNTCSVREKAEEKALGKLGLLAASKRNRPERRVGVMGCMAQRLGTHLLRCVPDLDFVVGTGRVHRLPEVIRTVMEEGGPVVDVGDPGDERPPQEPFRPSPGPTAFVNILYGCNRRCSYCIVPTVRGRQRSRPVTAILAEVEGLVRAGVREVTLLGQDVMAYGKSDPPGEFPAPSARGFREPFPRLLEAVSQIPGLWRLRFTSGHPSGCTNELVQAMAELAPVCEHLHLPLQSASDRILRRMRRGYTVETYRRAVARLRAAIPHLAITTDVIVGFPGETEEDFERTRVFMDEIGFANAFVFKYSVRPGTAAAEWEETVPEEEKQRRNQILLADQNRRSQALHDRMVGQVVEVVAEGPSLRNAERWSGRTRTHSIVIFSNPGSVQVGDRVFVRIARAMPQTLYGEVVSHE